MMLEVTYHAAQLITQTLVNLYVFMVCLRVLLDWSNVSYANPILLMVAKFTQPFLRPIYSIIPTINGLDLASIILLSFLSMLKIAMLFWWQTGYILLSKGLLILAFAEVLKQFIDIFFFIIMLFSLMSWFNLLAVPALVEIVFKLASPLLRLAQRVLPPISNMDFSPLCVMLGLQLLILLIVTPLSQIGLAMIKKTLVITL